MIKDVKKAYNEILFANEKLQLMEELEHYFSELNKAGELKYQTGDISYLEKVSAQSKFKAISLEKSKAETELSNARNKLQEAVFADNPVMAEDTSLMTKHPLNLDGIQNMPENNPELLISESVIETARAASKAKRAVSWPDPFVRISKTDINRGDSFNAFELGLKFPIDFWGESGRNQSARIESDIVEQQEKSFRRGVETKFMNLLNDLKNYKDQLNFYNQSRLKEATLIAKNALIQYKAGNIDYLQYVQYFDQSTGIQLDYLQVLKEYNNAAIEMEYMNGNKF
jgi:cobalt-zinc-cadmium resistance protein CzcA